MAQYLLLSLAASASLLAGVCSSALAQQPVQPLPKVGSCPLGYYSSGGYCVPSSGGNTRGAIEKSSAGCPLGFYSSGNYCLSSTPRFQERCHPFDPSIRGLEDMTNASLQRSR